MSVAEQVGRVLEQITYRKGWELQVLEGSPMHAFEDSLLMITVITTDSYHPDNVVQIGHRYPLPYEIPDEEIPRWIFHCLMKTEEHEAKEWFRVNGVVVYDPHWERKV